MRDELESRSALIVEMVRDLVVIGMFCAALLVWAARFS
jgi:hypothetical protein